MGVALPSFSKPGVIDLAAEKGAAVAQKGARVAQKGARVAQDGARAAAPWIEKAARLGYAAKGMLYLTIGALAFQSAIGSGDGRTLDSDGALREMHAQWFGTALLVVMTLGLAGHALWRLVQGTLDPEGDVPRGKVPIVTRISFLSRGVLQAALVVSCVKLLLGERSSGGVSAESLTAQLMAWHDPVGAILVFIIGAVVVGFAISEVHKAWVEDYAKKLDGRLPRTASRLAVAMIRIGTCARALIFAVIGAYLVYAAIDDDPREAKGFGDALASLHGWSFGWLVLAAAGVGVICYGAFQLVMARHRVIEPA